MLKINIWKRAFNLEVVYDCYPGEKILQEQKDALTKFVSEKNEIEKSRKDVEKYCLKYNGDDIGADHIDNIFKYVMPESIYVTRDGRVSIMCNYRFDIEHGLAVVFKDNRLEQIDQQDIVL